jgi:bifunctional ADP-heptose synthase (sugar kinase/adenylyltransferase)
MARFFGHFFMRHPDFHSTAAVLIGGLMLDRCWQAAASRSIPEASVAAGSVKAGEFTGLAARVGHDCAPADGGGERVLKFGQGFPTTGIIEFLPHG